MSEKKEEFIKELRQIVSLKLDLTRELSDDDIRDVIIEVIGEKSKERYFSLQDKRDVMDGVFNSIRGLDVLQPLIDDPSVTEIMINGPDNIFIEQNGKFFKKNVHFDSNERLENVIQNIVAKVNRTVNESTPIVDARLKDGSRVSVVLPPIALNGPTVTIRRFPERPMTVEQLIAYQSITPEVAELIHRMVKAKYNIFISGGTGSGYHYFFVKNQEIDRTMDYGSFRVRVCPDVQISINS